MAGRSGDYSEYMPESYYKLNKLFILIINQHKLQNLLCMYGSLKHYSNNIILIGCDGSEFSVIKNNFVSYTYERKINPGA